MSDKTYIGIGHKCRQGKDTFARALHALLPGDSKIIGFADALKVYCRVELGMTTKDAPLLQRIGLLKRHEQGENFWVNILKLTAEEATERVIIVPDVRFFNEAHFIQQQDGHVVKVTRIHDGAPFVSNDRDPNHPSETGLDTYMDWDYMFRCRSVLEIETDARMLAERLFPVGLANAA